MYRRLNQSVVCADGFRMSVQANDTAYCSPRHSDAGKYSFVEVGFPSEKETLLMPWAESPEDPTGTVYGYVPVDVVTNVLVKHGGMVEGEVPPGVIAVRSD